MKIILSFEGGGIKGIRSQTVAAYLETVIQNKTGKKDARLSDYVDMIAGTSTGAIQTAMHLFPVKGKPISALDILDFYFDRSAEIFSKKKPLSLLFSPKYSGLPFLKIAKDIFGEARLSSLTKTCFIPSYDLAEPKEYFFTNWEKGFEDSLILDAVLSSCFAPTYFSPYIFSDSKGQERAMWDGGVFMGNPALGAFTEAIKQHGTDEEFLIVSFTTGHSLHPFNYKKLALAGAIGTIQPLLDVMLSASGRTVSYHLNRLFKGHEPSLFYSLDPNPIYGSSEMDDISDKNLKMLHQDGALFCYENKALLEEIADKMIANQLK